VDRVRRGASVAVVLLFSSAIALTLFAGGTTGSVSAGGYSHGTTNCLQGNDGPGVCFRLWRSRDRACEGHASYPYLEIDVRDQPILTNTRIIIGETNWAFSCQTPKRSCDQFVSGEVMFNHFEESSGKEIQADGWYELRFRTGPPETGRFKVDCFAPCG